MSAPRYRYQPSTAEFAAAAGIDPGEVIRFDHNTSPFPPEWAASLGATATAGLNEYPAASYDTLRESAGSFVGLAPDHVAPGAGIDELILLTGRAFAAGGRAAALTPSYPLYRISAHQAGASYATVGLEPPNFDVDADLLLQAARQADLLWLCTPNNPTGNAVDGDVLDAAIAATDGVVVIDGAYAELAGDDWAPRVEAHHNLLVLRTMSKAFSLAGARVGYAMGHPSLVDAIDAARPPGSISSVSLAVAVAALADLDRMRATVDSLRDLRTSLAQGLEGLGWRALPSETNFVLCEVGPEAGSIADHLAGAGLIVRTFGEPLAHYLRITVRAAHENERLLAELREMAAG